MLVTREALLEREGVHKCKGHPSVQHRPTQWGRQKVHSLWDCRGLWYLMWGHGGSSSCRRQRWAEVELLTEKEEVWRVEAGGRDPGGLITSKFNGLPHFLLQGLHCGQVSLHRMTPWGSEVLWGCLGREAISVDAFSLISFQHFF